MIPFMERRSERVSKLYESLLSMEGMTACFPTKWWPNADIPEFEPLHPEVCTDVDKMWRYALTAPYCQGSIVKIFDRKSVPAMESVNTDWESILQGLNHVGRPSGGGEFMRPTGRWTMDLVNTPDGYRILEAAHALHHMRELACDRPDGFLECLAEIAFAKRYGVTFWCPTGEDIRNRFDGSYKHAGSWFDSEGARMVVSTNIRKPWLSVGAVGQGGLEFGRTRVAILSGIHLEPQPWSTREDNPNDADETWLEMNRWSCLPSIVTLCGWMFVDELLKMPLVGRYGDSSRGDVMFTCPVTRLDGPSTIDEYMSERFVQEDNDRGIWKLGSFMEHRLPVIERCIPPFPCMDCFRLNMASEGAPTRPMHARPEKGSGDAEADAEWKAYDDKVAKIVRVVEKACAFHDIRFKYKTGGGAERRSRKSKWRKLKGLSERIDSSLRRVERAYAKSFYSKAEAEMEAIDAMLEEMTKTIGGTSEND